MATIYIYNYNNYYNRRVKGQNNSLSDYGTPIYVETGDNVNFNPNDGVMTTYTAGRINNAYSGRGDYLVYSEDNVSITSRWFILEADRTRNGQYRLQLRRDVIVDNYDAVMNSTAYISNGMVLDDNPLIYNQEPITTNQIKTSEQPLKDDTGVAWVVGYVSRSAEAKNITMNVTTIIPDFVTDNISQWKTEHKVNQSVISTFNSGDLEYQVNISTYQVLFRDFYPASTPLSGVYATWRTDQYQKFVDWSWAQAGKVRGVVNQYKGLYEQRTPDDALYDWSIANQGKIVYDSVGKRYYKIIVEKNPYVIDRVAVTTNKSGNYLFTYLTNWLNSCPYKAPQSGGAYFYLRYAYRETILRLEEMTYDTYKMAFPGETERYHLKDAPYDMFAIPYGDISLNGIPHNQTAVLAIAQEIARNLTNAVVYDLQLVPFCPFTGWNIGVIEGVKTITLTDTNAKRVTYVTDDKPEPENKCVLVWCTASSGTRSLYVDHEPSYTNKKMSNQCDIYRLVSPNYNGQFEFNLAKNDTSWMGSFNVDFTYLPYNPYIHINPEFSGLYGKDYNDARGLICGGDFSLARVSDAWEQYQLQNKNYQAIFDRQIQKMDVDRKYQRIEEGVGAVAGSFQTSAQGFMVGGGIGAAVGGILGLSAGLGDMALSEGKYNEQKSYATDIHNMQLENIRALPYSLSKTTAFNFNNKIFPILEYYTCTDTEKNIVAYQIANRGMTINAIGKIIDYTLADWSYNEIHDRGFVRASVIQIDIEDDTHLANAISEELQKGVYFK